MHDLAHHFLSFTSHTLSLCQPAGFCRHSECLQVLLGEGASALAETKRKDTCLHLSAENGHAECLELLLRAWVRGRNGVRTSLPEALVRDALGEVKMVDKHNALGFTALHLATYRGSVSSVRALIASGASLEGSVVGSVEVSAWLCQGSTALHLAAARGFYHIVLLLLEAQESVPSLDLRALRNSRGLKPSQCALVCGHHHLARLLVESRALAALRRPRRTMDLPFAPPERTFTREQVTSLIQRAKLISRLRAIATAQREGGGAAQPTAAKGCKGSGAAAEDVHWLDTDGREVGVELDYDTIAAVLTGTQDPYVAAAEATLRGMGLLSATSTGITIHPSILAPSLPHPPEDPLSPPLRLRLLPRNSLSLSPPAPYSMGAYGLASPTSRSTAHQPLPPGRRRRRPRYRSRPRYSLTITNRSTVGLANVGGQPPTAEARRTLPASPSLLTTQAPPSAAAAEHNTIAALSGIPLESPHSGYVSHEGAPSTATHPGEENTVRSQWGGDTLSRSSSSGSEGVGNAPPRAPRRPGSAGSSSSNSSAESVHGTSLSRPRSTGFSASVRTQSDSEQHDPSSPSALSHGAHCEAAHSPRPSDAGTQAKEVVLGDCLDADDGCAICMDGNAEVAVSGCQHGMCLRCAYMLCTKTAGMPCCPFCRAPIASFAPAVPAAQ